MLPALALPAAVAAAWPLVEKYAPQLLGSLLGPRGAEVAQDVLTSAGAVVGTPDAGLAAESLAADPAKRADFLLEMARIQAQAEAERARIAAESVAGARQHHLELVRAGSPMAWGSVAVSAVILVLFAAVVLGAMAGFPAPDGVARLIEYAVIAVVSYWVGSSAGSARKDEALRGIAAGPFGGGGGR